MVTVSRQSQQRLPWVAGREAPSYDKAGTRAAERASCDAARLSRPLDTALVELVARWLRVLGLPARVELVELLQRRGPLHVQALAEVVGATQQNTSKQLTVLWRAGILSRCHDGRITRYWVSDPDAFAVIEQVAILTVRALQHDGMIIDDA